jgi:hypothetical protein
MNPDGSLRYAFSYSDYGMPIGSNWVSSLGQGGCASALVRAYQQTGDRNFLDCASNAIHYMLRPAEWGGCAGSLGSIDPSLTNYPFLTEYPFPTDPYVLDGSLSGLLGLWDWCEYEPSLLPTFYKYLETIKYVLPYYDANGFSWYDLQTLSLNIAEPAQAGYQRVNTALIWTFDSIAPSPVLNRTWHTWAAFVNQPLPPSLESGAQPRPDVPWTRTNITALANGGNLSVSWPSNYVGWVLQTNTVDVGNSVYWGDVAGSQTKQQMTFPTSNATIAAEFFRLRHP